MSTESSSRAWVEVRPDALRRNLETVRDRVPPGVRLIPMVKADAYGVGLAGAVHTLQRVGPWAFGVATLGEGRRLRELGVERRILVFSPLPAGSYPEAVELGLTPCLSDLASLEALQRAARHRDVPFHLEIDTGMGRAGFDWRAVGTWGPAVLGSTGSGIRLEGCFTHFHSADEPDLDPTHTQWSRFQEALARLGAPPGLIRHACNSAAALRVPDYAADAVRPGVFLYGGQVGLEEPLPAPVVSVRARVVYLREAPAGTTAGYGATYSAPKDSRWATLAIGYGDGLPRALGNRGSVLLGGARAPIIGRISMDMTVVDISDIPPVGPGQVATLLGRDGSEEITLEEIAGQAGTIGYEILTGLTARLPRIWMEDGDD